MYPVDEIAGDMLSLDNLSLASIGVVHGLHPNIPAFSSSLMA
jgi:hypothetical protein